MLGLRGQRRGLEMVAGFTDSGTESVAEHQGFESTQSHRPVANRYTSIRPANLAFVAACGNP
jgi:hypothetical protein